MKIISVRVFAIARKAVCSRPDVIDRLEIPSPHNRNGREVIFLSVSDTFLPTNAGISLSLIASQEEQTCFQCLVSFADHASNGDL